MRLKEELKKLKNSLVVKKQEGISSSEKTDNVKSEFTEKEKKMLEDFHIFREGESLTGEVISKHLSEDRNIDLNTKVDNFINWYYKNMVKGNYTDIGEFHKPNEMRNFIEKMAVWYELRYPDYEINRLMPGSSLELNDINEVMFNNNKYINELFDEFADVRALDWAEFYNTKAFINSLPWSESYLLSRARYGQLVYLSARHIGAHLHLTSRGFVEMAEDFGNDTNFKVKDQELIGMHIKDVLKLLKERGVSLQYGNGLEEVIKKVENWNYQKEEMLNCVMCRIIERGGNRMGPRRAFLFAKEFGRNIDIPMKYGIDYSDPGLIEFVNVYIKNGGSPDLLCYVGYFSRTSKIQKLDTISVRELIKILHTGAVAKYSVDEIELYQRLVNVLANNVDNNEVIKDDVKQLRLQRKLEKSKKIMLSM